MITSNAWRLIMEVLMISEDIELLPCILVRFVFFVWYARHPPVSCSICFQRLGFRSAVSIQFSHPCSGRNWWLCWLSVTVPVWSFLPLTKSHPWFVWIPSIWTGLLLPAFSHSSICRYLVLAWCCWQRFCFCRSWCPCRIQQLFSPAFQCIVAVLCCLPQDRYRQQTARC